MLRGGKLEPQQIVLTAEGEKEAKKLAQVLIGSGQGGFFTTEPFQERVNVDVASGQLTLRKSSSEPFTYEEVKQIGRPLRAYSRKEACVVEEMLQLARGNHDAPFTFFYPGRQAPVVEVCFLLNHVVLQMNVPYVKKVHMNMAQAIQKEMGQGVKVFSNHYNALSILHDSMNALFMSYKTFCAIGDALAANDLIPETLVEDFAIKASMAGLKCTAFLEARQLCVAADQTFEAGDAQDGNVIEKQGMKPVLGILSALAKSGSFTDLNHEQLEFLFAFLRNPQRIQQYQGTDAVKVLIRSLTENYPEEICHSSSQTADIISVDPKNGLLESPT